MSPAPYSKTVTVFNGMSTETTAGIVLNLPGFANTAALSKFFPTVSAAYSGAPGSTLTATA